MTEPYELATAAPRQDPGRDLGSLGIDRLPLAERLRRAPGDRLLAEAVTAGFG